MAPQWHVRTVAAADLHRLWPLARICEPRARFDDWRAGWERWLREARTERHLRTLAAAGGAVELAAWMAEVAAGGDAPLYLVVRLWLVEPAVPGRVLGAWFAALHRCAEDHRCLCIEVARTAVPAVWSALAARVAPEAGFVAGERGWRADVAPPHLR